MKNFKELDKRKVNEVETSFLTEWQKQNILEKTIENRNGASNWVFYDGPATANGMPGLHHMVAKFLKDSFCKYQTMKGSRVLRKIGWDTHGLPVEVAVEKKLGFTGKSDIEKYGIKEFNQKLVEESGGGISLLSFLQVKFLFCMLELYCFGVGMIVTGRCTSDFFVTRRLASFIRNAKPTIQ